VIGVKKNRLPQDSRCSPGLENAFPLNIFNIYFILNGLSEKFFIMFAHKHASQGLFVSTYIKTDLTLFF